jgi:hypothetical protein
VAHTNSSPAVALLKVSVDLVGMNVCCPYRYLDLGANYWLWARGMADDSFATWKVSILSTRFYVPMRIPYSPV